MVAAPPKTAYYFDQAAADRAVDFFPRFLRHSKGEWAGQPINLVPWQERIIRDVFGWKRPDGTRRYRRVYIEVPRKNGKSTMLSGLGIYLLAADGEAGAEIYSVAGDREQARIVFDAAKQMVVDSPTLQEKAGLEVYRSSIVRQSTSSSYKVLSSDVNTKHGFNAHGVLFDELHTQPNRELWDVMTTSVGARCQPLIIAITTAGYDRHSICYEVHQQAEQALAAPNDWPDFYPVIYNAGDLDWHTPEAWRRANPSLGVTVQEEFLAEECRKAIETPGYQNTFRRLFTDEWTEQSSRWIDMAQWDLGSTPVDAESLRGRRCYGGLDLARVSDLSAFLLLFPPEGEAERWKVLVWYWCPEDDILQRSRRDRVPYDVWRDQGLIIATPGNATDFAFIEDEIIKLAGVYNIQEISYDRTFADQMVYKLMEEGLTMVGFGQGFLSMAPATAELGRLLKAGMLQHGGHPILRWNAGNAVVKQDPAGNLKPDKEKATGRIDGVVALLDAVGRAVLHDNKAGDWTWGAR